MAKQRLRRRGRTAPVGPDAQSVADRDFWDDPNEEGRRGAGQIDDVAAWLELPPGFKAPDEDGGAYRKSSTVQLDPTVVEEDDAKWSALEWAD